MIIQLLSKITANSLKVNFLVATYLLVLSLTIRFPFFFRDVITWDESTLILMGQSTLDGYLPYTELWDNKPPLAFLAYGLFIALFGKSIISIRFSGALCLALGSWFTYLIGKTLWNRQVGILGGTLFIIFSCFLPGGQATMTEHIALVPLVSALSLLITKQLTPRLFFFTGILIAIATLIRLNLAYVAVIIGIFIGLKKSKSWLYSFQCGLAYAAGNILVIFLTYLPYAIAGYSKTWWKSVILAPFTYANSQLSLWETFTQHLDYIEKILVNPRSPLFSLSWLVWIGGLLGIGFIISQWRNTSDEKRQGLIWLFLFLSGTTLSILKSGAARDHYLIQLVPFMALTTATLSNISISRYARLLISSLMVLIMIISIRPILERYKIIISRIKTNQELNDGIAYQIATYLKQDNKLNEPIYMMSEHLTYWFINQKPLSKSTTHPSNISREYLLDFIAGQKTSTEQEMAKILAQKPKYIVRRASIWYLPENTPARILLEKTLQSHYKLVKQIEETQIYRRI